MRDRCLNRKRSSIPRDNIVQIIDGSFMFLCGSHTVIKQGVNLGASLYNLGASL